MIYLMTALVIREMSLDSSLEAESSLHVTAFNVRIHNQTEQQATLTRTLETFQMSVDYILKTHMQDFTSIL